MSRLLSILIHPNPILRNKSEEINEKEISSHEFQELCLNMAKTMQEKKGAGLAAPQVNKNIRLIVINVREAEQRIGKKILDNIKSGTICLINPKITKKSWAKEWGEEGCLSLPEVFGQVKRHKKIKCKYFNNQGKLHMVDAEGLLARVIQHEVDHLDGILFIDKARNIKKD